MKPKFRIFTANSVSDFNARIKEWGFCRTIFDHFFLCQKTKQWVYCLRLLNEDNFSKKVFINTQVGE